MNGRGRCPNCHFCVPLQSQNTSSANDGGSALPAEAELRASEQWTAEAEGSNARRFEDRWSSGLQQNEEYGCTWKSPRIQSQ